MKHLTTKERNRIIKAVINNNTLVPILSSVCLEENYLTATDLEVSVRMPYQTGIKCCVDAKKFYTATELMEAPVFSATTYKEDKPTFYEGVVQFYGDKKEIAQTKIIEGKEGESMLDFCKRKKIKQVKGKVEQEEGNSYDVKIKFGKKEIKVMGESIGNFPKLPDMENAVDVATWTEKEIDLITTAMVFTSHDDLRPAMTGIYFGKEIVATDAHRMFFHPITPIAVPFIIPYKAARLLTMIGGNWKVKADGQELTYNKEKYLGEGKLLFENENRIQLYARAIDARYPDYAAVIPNGIGNALISADISELSSEIKTCLQFSYAKTGKVDFRLNGITGKVTLHSQDVDLSHEYTTELEKAKVLQKEKFDISFNGNLVNQILLQIDSDVVKFKLWHSEKAVIINDHYLIMPVYSN